MNKILKLIPIIFFLVIFGLMIFPGSRGQSQGECDPLGWFPTDFGLKDHSVFFYDEYYYIVSIYLPGEKYFAYARSQDLCHWEDLSPILTDRTGEWDNLAIWAPHVIEVGGVYYMYYTGVKGPYPYLTQSIMLATSNDPADPSSWVLEGMVFQPDHPGMIWDDNSWADCRDPMVIRVEDTFYMYYTGRDVDGGIIGLATATTPDGPWIDWGNVLLLENDPYLRMPESPTIFVYQGLYYLFYNSRGEQYRIGASPGGPWSTEYQFIPGWAHEVWFGNDGKTYSSYLSDYTVTISPIGWDDFFQPPHPFIGEAIHHLFMPLIIK